MPVDNPLKNHGLLHSEYSESWSKRNLQTNHTRRAKTLKWRPRCHIRCWSEYMQRRFWWTARETYFIWNREECLTMTYHDEQSWPVKCHLYISTTFCLLPTRDVIKLCADWLHQYCDTIKLIAVLLFRNIVNMLSTRQSLLTCRNIFELIVPVDCQDLVMSVALMDHWILLHSWRVYLDGSRQKLVYVTRRLLYERISVEERDCKFENAISAAFSNQCCSVSNKPIDQWALSQSCTSITNGAFIVTKSWNITTRHTHWNIRYGSFRVIKISTRHTPQISTNNLSTSKGFISSVYSWKRDDSIGKACACAVCYTKLTRRHIVWSIFAINLTAATHCTILTFASVEKTSNELQDADF